jgi:hypothetical protein
MGKTCAPRFLHKDERYKEPSAADLTIAAHAHPATEACGIAPRIATPDAVLIPHIAAGIAVTT